MPTLTITQSYVADTLLTEAQLDDIKDSIETFFNITKLDEDNIQVGGIISDNLVDGIITDTILEDDAVITAKLVDQSVIKAKLVALGNQESTQTGGAFAPLVLTAVPDLDVTLTTLGRPVLVKFYWQGNGIGTGTAYLYRDGTQIGEYQTKIGGGAFSQLMWVESAYIDPISAGTYVYGIRYITDGSPAMASGFIQAYEL